MKPSGHARLRSVLVLRDALAAELGLPLPAAMLQTDGYGYGYGYGYG